MNNSDQETEHLSNYWLELIPEFPLGRGDLAKLKSIANKYPHEEVKIAMRIAVDQYIIYQENSPTYESAQHAFSKISGICRNRISEKSNPDFPKLLYIRGILKNRFGNFDEKFSLDLLCWAHRLGAPLEYLTEQAKSEFSWTKWRNAIIHDIDTHSPENTSKQNQT